MSDAAPAASDPATSMIWTRLARAPALAVLVDLDGTLLPFAPTLEEAALDDAAAAVLRGLAAVGVAVVVVSGRPRAAIDPIRAAVPAAWWFAEHGAWRHTDGSWQPPTVAAELGDLARRRHAGTRSRPPCDRAWLTRGHRHPAGSGAASRPPPRWCCARCARS